MGIRLIFVLFAVVGTFSQEVPDTTTTSTSTSTSTTTTSSSTTSTTTTTDKTTTSPSTTTTSPSTTTPGPTPKPDSFFRVTEDGVTCVMFSGDIKFKVDFPTTLKTRGTASVKLPSPSDDKESVTVTGSCGDPETGLQWIKVTWGPTNGQSSYTLQFNATASQWSMISTDATLFMDHETFANATDAGNFLRVTGMYPGLSLVPVAVNTSLTCHSLIDSKNFTGEVSDSNNTYTITGTSIGFKGQAYNAVPNDTNLQNGIRCEADQTSDLVPIAVGCALAGLVVLVLISYLVGRRRRSAAYQSV